MAKNRSASKLIHYDQKQRSNKKPQGAVETIPKTPQARKEKVRSRVAEISQRKRETTVGLVVGDAVTQKGWKRPGKTNKEKTKRYRILYYYQNNCCNNRL